MFKIQVFVPEDPRLDPKSEIHKKETHLDLDNVILLETKTLSLQVLRVLLKIKVRNAYHGVKFSFLWKMKM